MRIKFAMVDEQTVCVVSVASSGKPVFTKPAKGSGADGAEFWVRIGNATRQLHGDDMVDYQAAHWG